MNTELNRLDEKVRAVRLEAFAPSTRRTRNLQWRINEQFCLSFKLPVFPMLAENVCRFLVWKSKEAGYVTLNNYVSALNVLNKLNGQRVDIREDYSILLTLRGLRRILGDVSNPMDPLLPNELIKMSKWVNGMVVKEWGAWTAILLAFRSLLREGHFLSDGKEDMELLTRQEIHWEQWGLRIMISRSKTIQFGQRHYEVPISYCEGPLCAVSAFRRYWTTAPASKDCSVLSDSLGKQMQYRYMSCRFSRIWPIRLA